MAAAASGGCAESFEALVLRVGPRLLRYLRGRVRDECTAEDLVQETFLRAYRHLGRYDPERSFSTWVFTIATRLAVSHARTRRGLPLAEIDPPDARGADPLETMAVREQHDNIWRLAWRKLPPGQLTALWLRYAEQMPIRRIAVVMGNSPGGVKVLLHRARRRLIECSRTPAGRCRSESARPTGRPTKSDEVNHALWHMSVNAV